MKKINTRYLTIAAIFAALICVVTAFIRIPCPIGYFNIGNSVILIMCCFITLKYGVFAGAVGPALADLLGYPAWILPTLIIKALMCVTFYGMRKLPFKNQKVLTIVSAGVCFAIPVVGYYFAGAILYGGLEAGLAQLPALILEYVANVFLFTLMYLGLSKTPLAALMDVERK